MRWILAIGLVIGLLVPVDLTASYHECYVKGLVYGSPALAEVDAVFSTSELCQIKVQRFERRIVLSSVKWRVEVDIPADLRGWAPFSYHWGQRDAYIGSKEIAVMAGPQEQG